MRSQFDAVVERLLSARSKDWLRVIDGAELEWPAEPEARPDGVVEAYRWLLDRVGEGCD